MKRVLVALVLLAAACSHEPAKPATTVAGGRRVFVVETAPCPGGGDCAGGVVFGGEHYAWGNTGCHPLHPGGELGGLYAVGGDDWRGTEARRIVGTSPRHAVAMRSPGDPCDGDVWGVALATVFPVRASEALAAASARCRLPADPEETCGSGGPFAAKDGSVSWLPEVVEQVNRSLAAGATSPHATPADAITDYVLRSGSPGDDTRVGFRARSRHEGAVQLRVLHQARHEVGDSYGTTTMQYDSWADAITLATLGGGPGWWVTSVRQVSSASGVDRAHAEAAWRHCCTTVIKEFGPTP